MKKLVLIPVLLVLAVVSVVAQGFSPRSVFDQSQMEDYKAESPYFEIKAGEEKNVQFPLLSTEADVKIAGVIADVTITQTYKNDGDNPIEAVYVFPASSKAAVYAMNMKIGDKTVEAVIREKQQAREMYEDALKQGKTASLLEQERPNMFKMNVGNILPGDRVQVTLKYTELLKPVNKIYEFVFPTIVGPRYSSDDRKTDKSVRSTNVMTEEPTFDLDINVTLNAGMPIANLECESHEVNIEGINQSSAKIELKDSEKKGADKDFILKYKLAGDKIKTGLLLSENGEEKFFLLNVQPPERPSPETIPPREYVFIMDISGSMRGFPLIISKKLLVNIIKSLRPQDKFNIITFAGGSDLYANESQKASQENIEKALQFIDERKGGGGTELVNALDTAFSLSREKGLSRTFVIATDGFISMEKESFEVIRNSIGDANIFPFGIGTSVNRYLIEGIAHAGASESAIVTNSDEAVYEAERFEKIIATPVMTDITVDFEGFLTYDIEPPKVPDVYADKPIVLYGKWDNDPQGKIVMKGITGDEELKLEIPVRKFGTVKNTEALKYLWARKRIQLLGDYYKVRADEKLKQEITELGLDYTLMTEFTSFVAIDSEKRSDTIPQQVNVPNPKPEYMSGTSSSPLTSSGMTGKRSQSVMYSTSPPGGSKTVAFVNGRKNAVTDELEDGFEEDPGLKMPEFDSAAVHKNIEYPEEALTNMSEGKVILKGYVQTDGSISKAKVVKSTATIFDEAAKKAVLATKAKPATKFGEKVARWAPVTVHFKIGNGNFKYQGKYYEAVRLDRGLVRLDQKEGYGEEIKVGDNIEISYKLYDQNDVLMDSVEGFEFTVGINEAIEAIDKAVTGLKKQSEFIVLSNTDNLYGLKPDISVRGDLRRVKFKIKITDLEIE